MRPISFAEQTHVLSLKPDAAGLPVQLIPEARYGLTRSLWLPDPEELAALAAGRPVELLVTGAEHPALTIRVLPEHFEREEDK